MEVDFSHTILLFIVQLDGRSICSPNYDTIHALAVFFGLHELEDKVKFDEGIFDWELFTHITKYNLIGQKLEAVNDLCDRLALPWTYKEGTLPCIAVRHLKFFFQHVTPLRIATLDGQHRQYMFNKMIQGLHIAQSVFPWDSEYLHHQQISDHSTIFRQIDNNVYTCITGNITEKLLKQAQQYSLESQRLKNESNYKQTFRDLVKQIYNKIDQQTWKNTFKNIQDYWNYDFTKSPVIKKLDKNELQDDECRWSFNIHRMFLIVMDEYFLSSLVETAETCSDMDEAHEIVKKAYLARTANYTGRNLKPLTTVRVRYDMLPLELWRMV